MSKKRKRDVRGKRSKYMRCAACGKNAVVADGQTYLGRPRFKCLVCGDHFTWGGWEARVVKP